MRIVKILLLLILFLNIASAAPPDFTALIPITAITVVIFLSLMNMLASVISSAQITAWVKTEMREVLAGVILVVIIYTFFITSTNISEAITGEKHYLDESIRIIEGMLSDATYENLDSQPDKVVGYDRAFHDLIRAGTKVRAAASYSSYLSIPLGWVGFTYSTAPLAGVAPLFASLAGGTQGLANLIFIYEGLLLLLRFSDTALRAILLPISLSLRIVPFTRKIGNTLIAVSLAAMVFLPFSVIVVDKINGIITYPKAYLTSSNLDELDANSWSMAIGEPLCKMMPIRIIMFMNEVIFAQVVCLPIIWLPGAHSFCVGLMQFLIYPLINLLVSIAHIATLLPWEIWASATGNYAEEAFEVVYEFLRNINNLVLLGYMNVILIGIITITGARSLSVALGGEWYLGGIQRLI
jgi:hypothetical protein